MKTFLISLLSIFSVALFAQSPVCGPFFCHNDDGYTIAQAVDSISHDSAATAEYAYEFQTIAEHDGWIRHVKNNTITLGNALDLISKSVETTDTWNSGDIAIGYMMMDGTRDYHYFVRPSYSDRINKTVGPEPVTKLDVTKVFGWKDPNGNPYPVRTVMGRRCLNTFIDTREVPVNIDAFLANAGTASPGKSKTAPIAVDTLPTGNTKGGGLDPANAGGPNKGQTQPVVVNVYLNADGTVASAKKDSTATPPVTTPVATPTGPMTVPVNVNTTTSYADSDSHQEVESYGKKHPKWCMDCHQKWRKCACRRYAEANQRSGYSSYSSVGNVLGACAGCGLHLGINHCGVGIGVGFNAGISGYQNSCPPQFPRSYISPGRPLTYDNRGLIQYVGGPTWTGHVVNGFTGYQ